MHAHPCDVLYVLGQHSGLNGVLANKSISLSGNGMGWGSRERTELTPELYGCPGMTVILDALHEDVSTAFSFFKSYGVYVENPSFLLFILFAKVPGTGAFPEISAMAAD